MKSQEANNGSGSGNEIYGALVERSRSGRMGKPLTFADYAGLFGLEGRAYAAQARRALEQAGISFDEQDSCEFLGVTG